MTTNTVLLLAQASAPSQNVAIIIAALIGCYLILHKGIPVLVRILFGGLFTAPIVYAVVKAMD